MALDTTTFISDLLNAGNDAFSNLFTVSIVFGSTDTSIFNIRATDVTLPKIGNVVATLPYQNSEFPIVTPGVSLDRRLNVVLRIDDNYVVLSSLYKLLHMEDTSGSGFSQHSENKTFTVIVKTLKSTSSDALTYTFTNCRLESAPSLTYQYSGANALNTGNLSIIFTDMEIKNNSSQASNPD